LKAAARWVGDDPIASTAEKDGLSEKRRQGNFPRRIRAWRLSLPPFPCWMKCQTAASKNIAQFDEKFE
jgi:hypothetical protein